MTLDDVLTKFRLDRGHDYRDPTFDGDKIIGVKWLGTYASIVERMKELLPDYEFEERMRRPGVGDPDDWVRVNIRVRSTKRGV